MDFYDDDCDLDHDTESSGNVLLRLSTTSKADAIHWIKVLGLACSDHHNTVVTEDDTTTMNTQVFITIRISICYQPF